MNKSIEWIKRLVRLSINEVSSEENRIENLMELKEEYIGFSRVDQEHIKNIMMTQFEINDLLYVLSMMLLYTKEKPFVRMLLETIEKGDFDCYIGSMLECQIMIHIKDEYVWKKMFHRKNMYKYSQILDINYPYIPRTNRMQKRVVIVVGQLLAVNHAPTRMVLEIAYVLQVYMGYEIILFSCPCDGELPQDLWYGFCGKENSIQKFKDTPMRIEHRGKIFRGYQINMGSSSCKEYSMMLSLIYAWNPMFVLDCATGNSVVGIAGTFTTLASLPMSLECPVSEGEILIRIGRMDEEKEEEYAKAIGENQTQLFLKEKFPVVIETSFNTYFRAYIQFTDERFLVAIVGNRLNVEISEDFVQTMKRILEKRTNVDFVIIGKGEGLETFFDDELFYGHIHYLGFCEDLLGIYQILDLYLNPKRGGGGFSSAMALVAGIPVVTLPDCDVAYNCGEEFIVQDYGEMVDIVCRYTEDKDFYNEKRSYAKSYKQRNDEEQLIRFVKEMVEGILKIMEKQER